MILFECVSFRYHQNSKTSFSLKEVSFELQKGEVVGVIGSNGSGKSTAAKLASGLIKPSSGRILVDGVNISESRISDSENKTIKLRAGIIFQNPENQIVGTTVEEDLAFGLENLQVSNSEMRAKIESISKRFGLFELLKRPVHELSGGQKQMLCIAGIIVMEPSWLIFDEPTAHLDPWSRRDFWVYVKEQCKEKNIGIIVISQLPGDLDEFDRILVFSNGELVFNDKSSLYVRPDFESIL
ncbi:MAG: ATP-binding cassette domain-containing protein [Candidatus Riflebacteria bacterium]|nr:ATP-binding cassette domain-containing protein [Candidatus Riflebacteria bacterium]